MLRSNTVVDSEYEKNLSKLKFFIKEIEQYYNNPHPGSPNIFLNIATCFLYQQVKLAQNILYSIQLDSFSTANTLSNSMCDATIQLLWMSLEGEERATMYTYFSNVAAFQSFPKEHRDKFYTIAQEQQLYLQFLKPEKNTISKNPKDFVNEWFQYNNGKKNYNKRSRRHLYSEWKQALKKQTKQTDVVDIYQLYKLTCGFKHYSPERLLSLYNSEQNCFIEPISYRSLSIYTAILSLEFTLCLVNETLYKNICNKFSNFSYNK